MLLLGLWTKAVTVSWKIVSCHWHIILIFVRTGTVLLYVVQAGVVNLCESVYKFRSVNRNDHCCVLGLLSSRMTKSAEQTSSREADSSDPFQFHTFYRNQISLPYWKFPLVPGLSQISQVFIPFPDAVSSKYALILSSFLCVGFPSGLFSSDFPTKSFYAHPFPPLCTKCCHRPPHPPWLGHHELYKLWSFSLYPDSPVTCSLLSTNFFSSILHHPQCVCFR